MPPFLRTQAVIFDMDGTLCDTESQKARAYVDVIGSLQEINDPETHVLALYERMVGMTDETMCRAAVDEFNLSGPLDPYLKLLSVDEHWHALLQLRLKRYLSSYGTAFQLAKCAFLHNIDLLRQQKSLGRKIAIATSSPQFEAQRVISAIGVTHLVEHIIGREQVKNTKPDPEIYLYTAEALGVSSSEVLVVEDSCVGIKAALSAGMACIAVANRFTESSLRTQDFLDQRWIAYSPKNVKNIASLRIHENEN